MGPAARETLYVALSLCFLWGCDAVLSHEGRDEPEAAGDSAGGGAEDAPASDARDGDAAAPDGGPIDAALSDGGPIDAAPADGRPHDVPSDDAVDAQDAQPDADLDAQREVDSASDPDADTEPDQVSEAGEEDVVLGCSAHSARIVSNTIPATIPAGDHATASVTVANDGLSTWTAADGFRLGSPGDSDPFVETPRVDLPAGVSVVGNPDAPPTHTFIFGMNGPFDGGDYVTDWRMLQEGECWFGETLTRTVTVEGDVVPGVCGPPLPPWEDERSRIKLSCGGAWCDATPTCHGCDYCAAIGLGCMPGTGPEPPCTPRCDCPVRPDGHPERSPCEIYFLGGRPFWRSDGEVFTHPDNDFLADCTGCTWIEVCWADGTRCTRVTF